MREIVVNTFLTLDGVMQAPGGPQEDPTGGFAHGGWSVPYWDDAMGDRMGELMGEPFDLVLGRRTYEIFAAHWPHVTDDPAADALNGATKYVASRTLESVGWANSTLLEGDVPAALASLKEQDGPEIQVHGSSNLIQTLLRYDLIDEFRLWFFPLVLGEGKRLFGDGAVPRGVTLVDTSTSSTGVLMATYRQSEPLTYGSFALAQPTDEEVARRERLREG